MSNEKVYRPSRESHTFVEIDQMGLYRLIEGRKASPKEGSYTTYLFEKGKDKILKKAGFSHAIVLNAQGKPETCEI